MEGGCGAKRLKMMKYPKVTTRIKKPRQNVGSLERKPRRRRDNDLVQYVNISRAKIAEHTVEFVELQARGDFKQAARIKNIISAYESRIGKECTMTDLENRVSIR